MATKEKRGFYRQWSSEKWSSDKTTDYFEGPMLTYYWPLFKISAVALLFIIVYVSSGSLLMSIFNCLMMILEYQYIIAYMYPNTIVMPSMDH